MFRNAEQTFWCILFYVLLLIRMGTRSQTPQMFMTTPVSSTRLYIPHDGYQPYWPGGGWVISGDPDAPSTPKPLMVGHDECHYLYASIGSVCARRSNNAWSFYSGSHCNPARSTCRYAYPDDFSHGYHTFDTYCEYLDAVYKSREQERWVFVHLGKCVHQDVYFKNVKEEWAIHGRAAPQMKKVEELFKKYKRTPF